MVAPKLTSASKARPCPVCHGDHKCSSSADGLLLCGRSDGPVPGFRHLGPAKGDPQWHCYRPEGDAPFARAAHVPPRPEKQIDFAALAKEFEKQLSDVRLTELACRLRLPGC